MYKKLGIFMIVGIVATAFCLPKIFAKDKAAKVRINENARVEQNYFAQEGDAALPGKGNRTITGKMTYSQRGSEFSFVFTGHGLNPGEAFSLAYLPEGRDPIPLSDLETVNNGGNLLIKGSANFCSLPLSCDSNSGAVIGLMASNGEIRLRNQSMVSFQNTTGDCSDPECSGGLLEPEPEPDEPSFPESDDGGGLFDSF